MYHANLNVNLMIENVIQIKNETMINVDSSTKNIIYVKKITFEILLHVAAKMVDIQQVLLAIHWFHVIKLLKKKKKAVPANFNEKNTICETIKF